MGNLVDVVAIVVVEDHIHTHTHEDIERLWCMFFGRFLANSYIGDCSHQDNNGEEEHWHAKAHTHIAERETNVCVCVCCVILCVHRKWIEGMGK